MGCAIVKNIFRILLTVALFSSVISIYAAPPAKSKTYTVNISNVGTSPLTYHKIETRVPHTVSTSGLPTVGPNEKGSFTTTFTPGVIKVFWINYGHSKKRFCQAQIRVDNTGAIRRAQIAYHMGDNVECNVSYKNSDNTIKMTVSYVQCHSSITAVRTGDSGNLLAIWYAKGCTSGPGIGVIPNACHSAAPRLNVPVTYTFPAATSDRGLMYLKLLPQRLLCAKYQPQHSCLGGGRRKFRYSISYTYLITTGADSASCRKG